MENQKRIVDGLEQEFCYNLNKWVKSVKFNADFVHHGTATPTSTSGILEGVTFQNTEEKRFKIKGFDGTGTSWFNIDGSREWCKRSGTTSERPNGQFIYIGYQFFDTTLGKPIWWSGSTWVDATGTQV